MPGRRRSLATQLLISVDRCQSQQARYPGRWVKSLQGERLQTYRVARRVDVLTDTQAIELDWLKGNKFHEGIGQALHYGDVTGQQPVLALISAYYNIFGAEQEKLEYVSGLCAAHGVEVWALTTRRE
jgi:hypothetical protein